MQENNGSFIQFVLCACSREGAVLGAGVAETKSQSR